MFLDNTSLLPVYSLPLTPSRNGRGYLFKLPPEMGGGTYLNSLPHFGGGLGRGFKVVKELNDFSLFKNNRDLL